MAHDNGAVTLGRAGERNCKLTPGLAWTPVTLGLPPSLIEIYSSDIKKVYKANGVPLYLGLALTNISAYIHLFMMSIIVFMLSIMLSGIMFPIELVPKAFETTGKLFPA